MTKDFKIEVLGKTYTVVYVSGKDITDWFKAASPLYVNPLSIDLETYANPAFPVTKNSGLLPAKSLIRTVQCFSGGDMVGIFDLMNPSDPTKNTFETHKDNYTRFQDMFLARPALISHNALFETAQLEKYAYKYDCYKALNINCTMNMYSLIAHALVQSYDPNVFKRSLEVVAKEILGLDLEKESQTSDWSQPELTQEQLEYCARDAIVPYLLYEKMRPRLEELELTTVYELNTKAQEALAHMNIHGIAVDRALHTELISGWTEEANKLGDECFTALNQEIEQLSPEVIFGAVTEGVHEDVVASIDAGELEFGADYALTLRDWLETAREVALQLPRGKMKTQVGKLAKNLEGLLVSVSSTKQLAEWLQRNLSKEDVENWPKTPKGKMATDAFAWTEHAEGMSIVKPIVSYKKFSKLISTYGTSFAEWFVDHPDGTTRLHPNFTLCHTETGRMSSYEPNIQNIPSKPKEVGSDLRRIFIPRAEGRTLVVADFSQIEIRAAAYLSGDQILIDAYEQEIDIHRLTASKIFGKALHLVTDDERKEAKNPNFALLFGGGGGALKKYAKKNSGIEMTLDHAKDLKRIFNEAYPQFYDWQMEQVRLAQVNGTAISVLGKLRKLDPENAYCTAINHPIQSTAAEIMLLTLMFVTEELTEVFFTNAEGVEYAGYIDAYLVNCVHDEISLDVADIDVAEAKTMIQKCMEKAMHTVFPEASLKQLCGISSGLNWKEAK